MKNKNKALCCIITLTFAIVGMQGFAYDFEIKQPYLRNIILEGILNLDKSMYFNITSKPDAEQKTCEVTYKSFDVVEGDTVYNVGNTAYTEWLAFPKFVEYNGEKYKVMGIGDHAFQDCAELGCVEITSTFEYIGKEAFRNCVFLYWVDALAGMKGLKEIRERAFENCRLQNHYITLYPPVHIGPKVFIGCSGLERIHIQDIDENGENEYVTAEEDSFEKIDGIINLKLLHFKKGLVDNYGYYLNNSPWIYFKEIEYAKPSPTPDDETEVIAPVTTSPVGDSRIYTIDGRAVDGAKSLDHLPKGIYICGGKKIIR